MEEDVPLFPQGRYQLREPFVYDCLLLRQSETLTAPADSHNTTGQINPKYHGTKGPLLTSLPAMGLPIDSLVLNTTIQLKSEFPFNLDMNSGNPLGLGKYETESYNDEFLLIIVNLQVLYNLLLQMVNEVARPRPS